MDDKEGHYIIRAGDVVGNPPRCKSRLCSLAFSLQLTRYFRRPDRIIRLLGQGTFGKVVEAYDNNSRAPVAVKIIRSIPKYRDASKIEVRVLKTLKANDPTNKQCVLLSDFLMWPPQALFGCKQRFLISFPPRFFLLF